MNFDQKIDYLKKKLIDKAKKSGITEDFGDDEVRQLNDMVQNGPEQQKVYQFANWCYSLDLNELKNL